jgi:hypothetical protein
MRIVNRGLRASWLIISPILTVNIKMQSDSTSRLSWTLAMQQLDSREVESLCILIFTVSTGEIISQPQPIPFLIPHLDLSSPLEVNEVVPDAKITAIKEGGYCSTAMVAVTDIPPHVTKMIPNRMYMANHRQVFQVKINRSASCRNLYAWNLYQGKASAVVGRTRV